MQKLFETEIWSVNMCYLKSMGRAMNFIFLYIEHKLAKIRFLEEHPIGESSSI